MTHYSKKYQLTSSYIYIIYSRYGTTTLPNPFRSMASVPFGNSFLLIGGRSGDSYDNYIFRQDILEFEPKSETWTIRANKLATGRTMMGATLVRDNIVNCVEN